MTRHVAFLALLVAMACSRPSSPAATTVARTNTTLTGAVVERLDAPPYSYLRVETEQGDVWAAVPMASIDAGAKVTIRRGAAVRNFHAPKLGKRFDVVVFGTM